MIENLSKVKKVISKIFNIWMTFELIMYLFVAIYSFIEISNAISSGIEVPHEYVLKYYLLNLLGFIKQISIILIAKFIILAIFNKK